MPGEMKKRDINDEVYREYEWSDPKDASVRRTYRITDPRQLWLYDGCTTHRVVDASGVVHCVPAIGFLGCVLRWKPLDPAHPVAF